MSSEDANPAIFSRWVVDLQCSYCRRWATHPSNPQAVKEEVIWKEYKDLLPEEMADIDALKHNNIRISHGVCNYCLEILERDEDIVPQKIRQLSLGHE